MTVCAFTRPWPDRVGQSGRSGKPAGDKPPIGTKDCPIDYGLCPLASATVTFHYFEIADLVSESIRDAVFRKFVFGKTGAGKCPACANSDFTIGYKRGY